MTVSSTLNRTSLDGNGVTVDIPISFPFQAQADLIVLSVVILTGAQTTKTLTTHYTISGTTDALGHYPNGGTVTFLVAPAATERIIVYRDPARTQTLDLTNNGSLPAESVEAQLDYLSMLIQRASELITRSCRQPDGDSADLLTLPSKIDRASKFLACDANGDPIAAAGTSANLGPVSAFINTLLDDANAATARATLGITVTTNKDDEFRVTGSADVTKQLAFEVDGVTTATTRTVTVQDLTGTMALVPTVAAYTGTASLAAGAGLARLSGATFTLTLPAVASSTNRVCTFRHQGTSLTQVYTIKGNGAETIIAQDATANTYLLYTNGEEVTLTCDGTNWYVTAHRTRTEWVDAGAMLIQAPVTPPDFPTTPDLNKVYWRREGNTVYLRYVLQTSSAAGSSAGSGNYLFGLPTNITFDTTVIVPVGTPVTAALRSEAVKSALPGTAYVSVDSASNDLCVIYAYTTGFFQLWQVVNGAAVGSASYALTNAELSYYVELSARAANWRL